MPLAGVKLVLELHPTDETRKDKNEFASKKTELNTIVVMILITNKRCKPGFPPPPMRHIFDHVRGLPNICVSLQGVY